MRHFVLLAMIFMHIVDDFYLQGILATLKQKRFWKDNHASRLYAYDWFVAMAVHSFSWAFMMMLPIAILQGFDIGVGYMYALFINAWVHGFVDNMKANRGTISLYADQAVHIWQIFMTYVLFVL